LERGVVLRLSVSSTRHFPSVLTVEQIRVDPPRDCPVYGCPREPTYLYVDPDTFYPVEIHGYADLAGLWHQLVIRYLTYEYLPRTPANLALTHIRAQHPNAVGP